MNVAQLDHDLDRWRDRAQAAERELGDAVRVTRSLYDALMTAHSYVSLIVQGKRPAITDHARSVARERLDRIDGALADAADYMPGGTPYDC